MEKKLKLIERVNLGPDHQIIKETPPQSIEEALGIKKKEEPIPDTEVSFTIPPVKIKKTYLVTKSNRKYLIKTGIIGRGEKANIRLVGVSLSVSRAHAVFVVLSDGTVVIQDHNSSNGTFINGQRLMKRTAYKLLDGDKVCLADLEFEVRITD